MIFQAPDDSFTQVTRKIASGLSNLSYPVNRQSYLACWSHHDKPVNSLLRYQVSIVILLLLRMIDSIFYCIKMCKTFGVDLLNHHLNVMELTIFTLGAVCLSWKRGDITWDNFITCCINCCIMLMSSPINDETTSSSKICRDEYIDLRIEYQIRCYPDVECFVLCQKHNF